MLIKKPFALGCLLLIACACALSQGCAVGQRQGTTKRQAVSEAPPPPEENPTPDTVALVNTPALTPPKPSDVSAAVERVFKGAAAIETGRDSYFVVGNFNDDDSQDMAVPVKPAPGRLPDMNDELAGWILAAPVRPPTPGLPYAEMHAAAARRRRVVVDEGDLLLAVIHGFGPGGWRNARATQTYVLKNIAGDRMRTRELRQVLAAEGDGKLPRLRGDVIAQTVGGQTGFLYYDGATYSWHDPRNSAPRPPARIVHGGPAVPARQ